MEGRCSQRELTTSRRYRQYECSARVSGSAQKITNAEGVYPEGPKVCVWRGVVDRSVTLSRKPTQLSRDGGSGCHPRVRGENLWRFSGKGERPSTGGSLGTCLVGAGQVVDRSFGIRQGGNLALERGMVGIARRTPSGRRGMEPGCPVKRRRIGRGPGLRR